MPLAPGIAGHPAPEAGPDERRRILAQRLRESAILGPDAQIREFRWFRYPNSSIAWVTVEEGGDTRRLVAKWLLFGEVDGRSNRSDTEYKREQLEREYRVLERMNRVLADHPRCAVIEPLAFFPEELCLVTKEAAGEKLATHLKRARRLSATAAKERAARLCRASGEWLRLFQEAFPPEPGFAYDWSRDLDYCRVRIAILREGDAIAQSLAETILLQLEEARSAAESSRLDVRGRHNDFGPLNILVSGERLTVLDLAGFDYGPPEGDLCKFLSLLETMRHSVLYDAATVRALRSSFVEGYGAEPDTSGASWLLARTGFVLDKMGDIVLDWKTFGPLDRFAYGRLFRHYRRWLEGRYARRGDGF